MFFNFCNVKSNSKVKYYAGGALILVYVIIFCSLTFCWTRRFFHRRRLILLHKRLPKVTILICFISILNNVTATIDLVFNLELFNYDYRLFGRVLTYLDLLYTLCSFVFHGCFLVRFWFLFFDINYIRMTVNSQWHGIIDPTFSNKRSTFLSSNKNKNKNQKPKAIKFNNKISFMSYAWFISKKKTLGNARYMKNRILLIYSLITIPLMALEFMHFYLRHDHENSRLLVYINQGIHSAVRLCEGMCVLWLYWKTPVIYDNFYVRSEMIRIFPIFVLLYALYIVDTSLDVVNYKYDYEHSHDKCFWHIYDYCYDFIQRILYTIAIYLSTQWVLNRLIPIMRNMTIEKNNEQAYYFNNIISSKTGTRTRTKTATATGHTQTQTDFTRTPSLSINLLNDNNNNNNNNVNSSGGFDDGGGSDAYAAGNVRVYKGQSHENYNYNYKFGGIDEKIDEIIEITDITLREILENKDYLELFMQHLSKEFSMELLLSMIEFTQFINLIIKFDKEILSKYGIICDNKDDKVFNNINNINNNTNNNRLATLTGDTFNASNSIDLINNINRFSVPNSSNNNSISEFSFPLQLNNVLLLIKFSDDIAQSLIVFSNDREYIDLNPFGNNNYLRMRCQLYYSITYQLSLKYIFINSEYEINIDSGLRSKFNKFFHSFAKIDLNMLQIQSIEEMFVSMVQLFNQCNLTNFCLMQDALTRFRKTKKYKKFVSKD